ncbi:mechanosensitive ion channel family protein [Sporosarcina highlanderae]|uniref:Mechanosensitive ion channel family protein n=1 Tax=Sporosarcina highlanderae TaxID=3035916 RepID=A0ABT8JUR1_9BACL|nr:mechanosensitive ion channel family protein [Sporosarcina highlanderae]MDN4608905.1 mechanosensitive ion channel family protein [Sporosarcina highlanderae]
MTKENMEKLIELFFSDDTEKVSKIFFNEQVWIGLLIIAVRIAFIIAIAFIVVHAGKFIIRRLFRIKLKGPIRREERRERTLLKLLENTLSYVVYFSAILAILQEFNIDVKGLLAGAGVLGLAVGFGAQSLVKDVISGFFILFEDQFSVGDYVKIGAAEGMVEEIGLRTTKLKNFTGEIFILPNGTISQVVNYSMKNSLAIVDVTIPFELGIENVEKFIDEFLQSFNKDNPDLLGKPKLIGAHDFTENSVIERIIVETKPMRHFDTARNIGIGLKKYLGQQGIEIPYPTLVTKSFDNQ